MLLKRIAQTGINFQPGTLPATRKHYETYEKISQVLDANPKILDLVYRDLAKSLKADAKNGRRSKISAENILRTCIAQDIENETLRRIILRIDESDNLRQFIRIFNEDMFSFTRFNTLKNKITPETWRKINRTLAAYAIEQEFLSGEKLRIDSTLVETNIHYPTDSSLLNDTYRVMARLIKIAKEIDPDLVGRRRLRERKARRLAADIARKSPKKGEISKAAKGLYGKLIPLVERILELSLEVRKKLMKGEFVTAGAVSSTKTVSLPSAIEHFHELGLKVVDQARRRVFDEEKVPSKEKLYSIFEPHTELIKRGKAGKPVEFGHMMLIEQVKEKFITGYSVFDQKPNDYALVEPALKNHKKLFGGFPDQISADKGFYEDMTKIQKLTEHVDVVSICKKGRRNAKEKERESTLKFRNAQRFRAGVEGTISVLKRALGMFRCMNKGWEHFKATIGRIILSHNLLILARTL